MAKFSSRLVNFLLAVFFITIGILISTVMFKTKPFSEGFVAAQQFNDESLKSAFAVQEAFRKVAKTVTPAVVNISSETIIRTEEKFFPDDPFMEFFGEDFFRKFYDIPREYKQRSLGTGFIISEDGYLISNFHVVRNATQIIVKLADGRKFKAKIVGSDPKTDLVVLKIDAKNLPYVKWGDSKSVEVGDWAIAIGNPFGLSETFTVGVISAKGRKDVGIGEYENYLQTDAAINPGNSGGPLVNIKGEVIGINTAIATPSGGNVGIGFAIPQDMAYGIISQLKSSGKIVRGYIGVYIQDLTEDIAKPLKLPPESGVLVAEVEKDGPADKAGIQIGDIIVEFNGKKISNSDEIRNEVISTPVGKEVKVKVLRDGKEKIITVKVAEMPAESISKDKIIDSSTFKWFGITFANLNSALKQKYEIKEYDSGVVIINFEENSPAKDAGLKEGDVVIKVNNRNIKSIDDIKEEYSMDPNSDSALFLIDRKGRKFFIAVTKGD